jgi:hypothetical protein
VDSSSAAGYEEQQGQSILVSLPSISAASASIVPSASPDTTSVAPSSPSPFYDHEIVAQTGAELIDVALAPSIHDNGVVAFIGLTDPPPSSGSTGSSIFVVGIKDAFFGAADRRARELAFHHAVL